MLTKGTILQNRYRIEKVLGHGGMGALYEAWDSRLNVRCVAKQTWARTADDRAQFEREAQILARLKHPQLPAVTDHFIEPNGDQFLVMEFVSGKDLEERQEGRGKPFSENEVRNWTLQLLAILDYLHRQSPPVIHRDIKPANVKITPEGRVMLLDFGIAKQQLPNMQTISGALAATPEFAPPEQMDPALITDARTDLYALGATMYLLLTGEPLPSAVQRMSGKDVTPPRQLNPDISPWIEQIVLRAVELRMDDRYQTAEEFRADLLTEGKSSAPTRMLTGTPPKLTSMTAQLAVVPRWVWAIIALAVMPLLCCMGLFFWGMVIRDGKATPTAQVVIPTEELNPPPPVTTPTLWDTVKWKPLTEPTPPPRGAEVEFEDDFRVPHSAWYMGADADVQRFVEDEQFHIVVAPDDYWGWARLEDHNFTDFVLDVTTAQIGGPTDGEFGVLFRYQDSDNYYAAEISANGWLRVFKMVEDEKYDLVQWETEPLVIEGLGNAHHLRVIAQESRLAFYINGTLAALVADDDFVDGRIALQAGTNDEGGVHVAFDDVRIASLPAERLEFTAPINAVSDEIVFYEDFTAPDENWSTDDTTVTLRYIEDDALHMELLTDDRVSWTTLKDYSFANYAVDVKAKILDGPQNSEVGILFDYQDSDNYYAVMFNGLGQWRVFKSEWNDDEEDGKWYHRVRWTTDDLISRGVGATYEFRVVRQNDRIGVLLDETLLGWVPEGSFTSGTIAAIVGTTTEANAHVVVEEITVRELVNMEK